MGEKRNTKHKTLNKINQKKKKKKKEKVRKKEIND